MGSYINRDGRKMLIFFNKLIANMMDISDS